MKGSTTILLLKHLLQPCGSKRFRVLVPCLSILWVSYAQPFQAGTTYFGQNNYVEYRAGNIPIIICAPHGGDLAPASIPNRICPNAVTVADGNTQVMTRQIDSALQVQLGCYPHIIICRLTRRKLDANREIVEAACGNAEAEQAWIEYHAFIDSAKADIIKRYGKGLLLDMHGHGHEIARLELGYLLAASTLRLSDSSLNLPANIQSSSIRKLVSTNLSNQTHAQLLRGPSAFGTQLHNKGFPSVPSQAIPAPLVGESYFNGGYTTVRHGSVNGGNMDAIQIECHFAGVRDTYQNRRKFADSLSVVVENYLEEQYFGDIFQPAIVGDDTVCSTNTHIYRVAALPGSSYTWTVQGGEIILGQGTPQVTILWSGTGAGSLSVTRTCPP